MHHFHYQNGELHCEGVPLSQIAQEVGTPCYVYSHATLSRHFRVFDEAFAKIPHLICFAMKANSNLAVLRTLIKLGAGIDIVSQGELFRAITAGADPNRIVYSGVGKTAQEIRFALEKEILLFNVESEAELYLINDVARELGKKASISIRVNPDINPRTHPYISTGLKKSKFGVQLKDSLRLYEATRKLPALAVRGVDLHIGSQITTTAPFVEALRRISQLVISLRQRGFQIDYLNLGGGLGITYKKETPPHPRQYSQALKKELSKLQCTILFEPGRVIVGNAGILLTRALFQKQQGKKRFLIVDAAMNDLIRPALYGAYHEIVPVRKRGGKKKVVDVVGPVCESGDFLAEKRALPPLEGGDLLAVMSAGAYGFVMASNYNSRLRAAEVLVKDRGFHIVRQREEWRDLLKGEHVPKFLV